MMNPGPPLLCGTLLVAMLAAGASHFWRVHKIASRYPSAPALPIDPSSPEEKITAPPQQTAPPSLAPSHPPLARGSEGEHESYTAPPSKMKAPRNEHQNLTDQIGETYRDMMKVKFRMDTDSESFRPLPVQERFDDTSFGAEPRFPGVLPPRATHVYPLEE